ncbi:MAG: hypothetical protein H6531_10470 [Actinobacteria bacterium]|nr:hypothetical protein [Thermoleophilia bacterium]MCB9012240.1 hypothetical protein [Actinomycetota bacterium]
MRNDETPYPPSGSQGGASPDEVLDAAHFSESEAQADLASRLSMLDRLHEEGQISAAELKEARLRVMAEAGAPRGFDSDVVADSPGRPSSAVGGTSSSVTGVSERDGAAESRQAIADPTIATHKPQGRRILGLPVWGVAVTAVGAVVAGLVLGFALLGGDDASDAASGGGDTAYATQVGRPLGQLTSSVVVVGKGLARANEPGDLKTVNRMAKRQIDVVEGARRALSGISVRAEDRPAQQRLIKAAADQRRFLVALVRATGGTPSEASLKSLNQARSAAGQTLVSYRRFFAAAPAAPDAITATDITDVSGVRSALKSAIAAATPPPTSAAGSSAPKTGGSYGGGSFQSPTGNIRCQISGSTLYCSTSNDGFGVSLPGFGSPTTGQFTAAGGVVVPYGSSWSSGLFRCESAFDGITCSNQSGNGFFLNRDAFRPF